MKKIFLSEQLNNIKIRKDKYIDFSETYDYLIDSLEFIEERKNKNYDKGINNEEIAAITIISKNYCSFGLTLCKSFLNHHPGSQFFVIICDEDEDNICKNQIINAGGIPILFDQLCIPQREILKIRYSILELNTAIKPFALEFCLDSFESIKAIAYIDPDIKIYGHLEKVWNSLLISNNDICLTPHIITPIEDDFHPSEISILQSGTYNLGFIGLRRSNFCKEFLSWWQEKLYLDCVVDIPRGLFTDQKWIDLIPSFCERCEILKDYTYNVAYWNLHERKISFKNNDFYVNNNPLTFFHFSGFNPKQEIISKHQNRFDFKKRKDLLVIFKNYKDSLLENNFAEAIKYKYAFSNLEKNIQNNILFRFLMMDFTRRNIKFPSPLDNIFEFSKFILEPRLINGNTLSFFQNSIIELRPDVYDFYSINKNNLRDNFSDYLTWLNKSGFKELELSSWKKYLVEKNLISQLSIHPLEIILALNKTNFTVDDDKKKISFSSINKDLNFLFEFIDIETSRKDDLIEFMLNSLNKLVGLGLCRIDLQNEFNNFTNLEDISRYIGWLKIEIENIKDLSLCQIYSLEIILKFYPYKLLEIYKIRNSLKVMSNNNLSNKKIINFAGNFYSLKGTGEGARSLSRALDMDEKYLIKYINISTQFDSKDVFFKGKTEYISNSFYKNSNTSIFSFNADNSQYARAIVPKDFLSNQNIAYWAWETERLPMELAKFHKYYDQIWAVSNFTKEAILNSVVDKKVFTVPHCIDPWMLDNFSDLCSLKIKNKLEALKSKFSFGFILDLHSFGIRKNPEGLLKVFEKISEINKDIILVIKVSGVVFGDYEYEKLKAKFMKLNCIFIEDDLSKADIYYFLSKLDCYISLHRAEGFGLTLLESMSLGTLTIGTNYSGNLDFMNPNNSVLINTVPFILSKDYGPYEKGTCWREPNIDDCIDKIKFYMDSTINRSKIAISGKNYVHDKFKPNNILENINGIL